MADSAICQCLISNRDKIIGRQHVTKRENRTWAENGELAVAELSCNWQGLETGKMMVQSSVWWDKDQRQSKFGILGCGGGGQLSWRIQPTTRSAAIE